MKRVMVLGILVILVASVLAGCGGKSSGTAPTEVRVDWAYYSPLSMVIKKRGWMEEEFKNDGIKITWVLSQGSNKALEFLSTGAVDFGSTAGSAALMSRANGNPIQVVYIYGKPEWTALVVGKDSKIQSVADLKGKKVAATLGTDPFIFLLRILADAGLSNRDIEIVNIQHAEGRTSLERGQVDAWAGLDPHMAASELQNGTRLILRKPDYNTYGFLNVTEKFAGSYPEHTKRVLKVYEQARQWALQNPDELIQVVAEEANIALDVARKQVGERYDFSKAVPDSEHVAGLQAASKILLAEGLIKEGTDTEKVVRELVNDAYAKEVVK